MRKTVFILTLFFSTTLLAQDKLNVVQQAMYDEMDRAMRELKTEGFEKPFFINYVLLDQTSWQMSATLGALHHSVETKGREALSVRMLIGDYEFNDESLDNESNVRQQAVDIELPIDDDYLGIRRSLWVSTDNVYRSATRIFAKNKETLKEQTKPLSEVPHRTFAKTPPSKIDIEGPEIKFDRAATEEYIRKVSGVFREYKGIENSNVIFIYQHGYRYLVNSEGSINRVPVGYGSLVINAVLKTPEGEFIFENSVRHFATPDLPPVETMIAEAKTLAQSLISSVASPVFKEEYTGPVLITGSTAANLFYQKLFTGEDGLIASNNIPNLKGYRYETNSIDAKIGKMLFHEGMTVKAVPKMKKYGDTQLLGSFEVDDDGVVPADETILVENGVLKTLANDRTLTKSTQTANGLGDGPGVLMISFKNTIAEADMKAKLIAQAKKEGLDYGIMVKTSPFVWSSRIQNVYKVYVADGREELTRQASLKEISQRSFKRILEISKEIEVHHVNRGGRPTSVIGPRAILLEEVEFSGASVPTLNEEEYVPNPLKN